MTRPWLSGNRTVLVMGMVPAAIFVALLLYFTGWAITFSFTNLELFGRRSIDWDWVGFQNYERLFTRRGFLDSLYVTIVFCFFSALIGQSVLGFLLASMMRGVKSRLRTVIEVSLMLGWLIPDVVAAFLWSATANKTGMVNTFIMEPLGFDPQNFLDEYALTVVIIANIWKGTAWSYLLFSAALDGVSKEVVEAAHMDGASKWQVVRRVVLPMIRPQIATNMLFLTIWTFTYFPLIYAMTGGGPGNETEVLAIFLFKQSFEIGKLGYGAAISVAMLGIVGFLSIFYLRLLKEPE